MLLFFEVNVSLITLEKTRRSLRDEETSNFVLADDSRVCSSI